MSYISIVTFFGNIAYVEAITKDVLEGNAAVIEVGSHLKSDVRFADDQGMIATANGELQKLMDRLHDKAIENDMKINVNKTKSMILSMKENKKVDILIDGQKIE